MALVHQEGKLKFYIEASFQAPPHVRVDKGKGFIIIRIGVPEEELPYIEEYENVARDDIDAAFNIVWSNQEKFLNIWEGHHNFIGENETAKVSENTMEQGGKFMDEMRLSLKARLKKESVKEALGEFHDKRFFPLQKRLIMDLDRGDFKTISLENYLRLGGWSHTGGSYRNTMHAVETLCELIFGYQIPEKVGKFYMKANRYRAKSFLASIAPTIAKYHRERMEKGSTLPRLGKAKP